MLQLTANIIIGSYLFEHPISVSIESNINNLTDTATIELPKSAILQSKEILSVDKIIKRGDAVLIKLGYDNNLVQEFSGYVTKITAAQNVTILCDNEAYKLRGAVADTIYKNTTLKAILTEIANQFNIEVKKEVPTVNFSSFILKDVTGIQAINKLTDEYGLKAFFVGNTLHTELAYSYKANTKSVLLNMAFNVLPTSHSSLTFKEAEETKFKIKAVSILKNNTRMELETGDAEGELRTLYFTNIESESELKKIAEQEILKYKYTGYEGSLTTFGVPYITKGTVVKITDANYPTYEGEYYVEGVKVSFGANGYRRVVNLGIKL